MVRSCFYSTARYNTYRTFCSTSYLNYSSFLLFRYHPSNPGFDRIYHRGTDLRWSSTAQQTSMHLFGWTIQFLQLRVTTASRKVPLYMFQYVNLLSTAKSFTRFILLSTCCRLCPGWWSQLLVKAWRGRIMLTFLISWYDVSFDFVIQLNVQNWPFT